MRKQGLQFGPFEFDAARFLLFRGDAPVALGQRGAALLDILLKRRGEVLTKEELIDAAWPGLVVEEANLSVQISLLRRALGRTAGGGEWVVTVQRVGYRFIPAADGRAAAPTKPTLAVLPFTDFETGARSEADGLVEDLTTSLSKFRSIAVVARNTSFLGHGRIADIRQVARRLGAGYVLEGSLRRIGGRTRVNAQLIDGSSGSHLWAETFDWPGHDGDPDNRLAQRMAAMVEPQIQVAEIARSRAERPESLSAYDLYLRARWYQRSSEQNDNAVAYRLLQRALRQDPENVHILAAAAEALHHRDSVGWPAIGPHDRRDALDLARRGLALGVDDGAVLGLFGITMLTAREWDLGRVTAERAIEVNPYDSMALVCAGQASMWLVDTDRAHDHFMRAYELGPADPNRRFILNGLSVVQRRRGNYEVAVELAKRALAVGPAYSPAHWNLIASTVHLGRLDEARRYVARYRTVSPAATVASIRLGQAIVDERVRDQFVGLLADAGLPEG